MYQPEEQARERIIHTLDLIDKESYLIAIDNLKQAIKFLERADKNKQIGIQNTVEVNLQGDKL